MRKWKPVVGFPEYAVSNDGMVMRVIRDAKNHAPKTLSPWMNNKGYLIVQLCNATGHHKKLVSRLVCEAFNGPAPTNKHEAAHGDGKTLNNKSSNLRWATRSENMEDARKHGTMAIGALHGRTTSPEKTPRGEKHGHSKLTERDVKKIRSFSKTKVSGVFLAEKYGVSPATICNVRSGKTWSHI